ncbi:DNA glycosylase [Hygrophoropsis aurantiaca]|uniref:DNA glycosylase n=1 Tax=Hygrophoropsis aurantiaca TaxID=72124 RepID=A0ACB8A4I0_9AGAM|nr:DNA glycosylase [Hygrophoropsis aurantiaca]
MRIPHVNPHIPHLHAYHSSIFTPFTPIEHLASDPWKVIVATTLLNKTTGKAAIPVFWALMRQWGTPEALAEAPIEKLTLLLKPLGLYNVRARRLKLLSRMYVDDPPQVGVLRSPLRGGAPSSLASSTPHQTRSKARTRYPPTPISHLPGTGPYALDSYRIFCTEAEWKQVMPSDKELIRYLKWKWAYEEGEEWVPGSGVTRKISDQYLRALVADLRS